MSKNHFPWSSDDDRLTRWWHRAARPQSPARLETRLGGVAHRFHEVDHRDTVFHWFQSHADSDVFHF